MRSFMRGSSYSVARAAGRSAAVFRWVSRPWGRSRRRARRCRRLGPRSTMLFIQTVTPRDQIGVAGGQLRLGPGAARARTDAQVAIADGGHALQQRGGDDVRVAEAAEQVLRT